MKIQSCKAKGRKLQQLVASKISELLGIPWGKDELIRSREMGQSGVDVVLIGEALKKFNFSVECKSQEKMSIKEWIEQAKSNKKPNTCWVIVWKKNRMDPVVIMDLDDFLKMYKEKKL